MIFPLQEKYNTTARTCKRPGWTKWMYTLSGPLSEQKACQEELLEKFAENRTKSMPKERTSNKAYKLGNTLPL